jgi:hypothetical protein
VRGELGGRILTVGIVPVLAAAAAELKPANAASATQLLAYEMPSISVITTLPLDADGQPAPTYRLLDPRATEDVLSQPGLVQLALPAAEDIGVWQGLDPLEAGVGDLPPAIDDPALADRVITWVRIRATGAAAATLLWAGINATTVTQREDIVGERLTDGDGSPGQTRQLAHAPVLPGGISVRSWNDGTPRDWVQIDDLSAAGPEVVVPNVRLPPGVQPAPPAPTDVFSADAEAGVLTWGDGMRGRRLTLDATVFASYAFCLGAAGNVASGAIAAAPTLPSGFDVTNPVRTWGGADAETPDDGERQVQNFLRHGDRAVSAADFESIAWRTPGVDIGRIDVLAAFHPDLSPSEPGDAPGVVTLMAIPRFDPGQPDAPRADLLFLNALCDRLDPRRLVTTEVILRGATYKGIWISVGIDVASGFAVADVTESVRQQLRKVLSPLPPAGSGFAAQATPLFGTPPPATARGWPLRTSVSARVLLAEAARVPGVVSVADVLLAENGSAPADIVDMTGLELPRILGLSVVAGDPVPLAAVRGDTSTVSAPGPSVLPVPVVPETCA